MIRIVQPSCLTYFHRLIDDLAAVVHCLGRQLASFAYLVICYLLSETPRIDKPLYTFIPYALSNLQRYLQSSHIYEGLYAECVSL